VLITDPGFRECGGERVSTELRVAARARIAADVDHVSDVMSAEHC